MSEEGNVHVYTFGTKSIHTNKGMVQKHVDTSLPDTRVKDLIVGKNNTIARASIKEFFSAHHTGSADVFPFSELPKTDKEAYELGIRMLKAGTPADFLVVSRDLTSIHSLDPNMTVREFLGGYPCLVIASEEKFRAVMPKATIECKRSSKWNTAIREGTITYANIAKKSSKLPKLTATSIGNVLKLIAKKDDSRPRKILAFI